jgi:hypothetical protein
LLVVTVGMSLAGQVTVRTLAGAASGFEVELEPPLHAARTSQAPVRQAMYRLA